MKKRGFTLVEIMIVVAIIALLTAIAIPAFLQYRMDARRSLCVNNMRLLDHAKEVLAIKNGLTTGQAVATGGSSFEWAALNPYIDGNNLLSCPEDGGVATHYVYEEIDTTPTCPFVGAFAEHVYTPD